MIKLYRFRHIRSKMLLVIIIFLILPLLIITYTYSSKTENILQEQIRKENIRELDQINKAIESKLIKIVNAMNFFAINKQIKEVLFNGSHSADMDAWEESQHYYKNYLEFNDNINVARETLLSDFQNYITLFDFNDNIYTSLPKRNNEKDSSWRSKKWFSEVTNNKGYKSWVLHWDKDSDKFLITLARLINSDVDQSWRGVMTITYDEEVLFDDLIKTQKDEYILLIDNFGTVVTDSYRESIGQNIYNYSPIKSILEDGLNNFIYEEDGVHKFVSYTKNNLTNFYLAVNVNIVVALS